MSTSIPTVEPKPLDKYFWRRHRDKVKSEPNHSQNMYSRNIGLKDYADLCSRAEQEEGKFSLKSLLFARSKISEVEEMLEQAREQERIALAAEDTRQDLTLRLTQQRQARDDAQQELSNLPAAREEAFELLVKSRTTEFNASDSMSGRSTAELAMQTTLRHPIREQVLQAAIARLNDSIASLEKSLELLK